MLEIRLFRFDIKIDLLSYHKPYFYSNLNFSSLKELLDDIKKNDPYFEFEGVEFVMVNGYLTSLEESLEEVVGRFGKELVISSLQDKRAIKDLKIDSDDFMRAFLPFEEFRGEIDVYKKLMPLFYNSPIYKFKDDFIGNSAFVFTKHLLDKGLNLSDELRELIKNELDYYVAGLEFRDYFGLSRSVEFLQGYFGKEVAKDEPFEDSNLYIESFDKNKFINNFAKFNIAIYDDLAVEKLVRKIDAKVVCFENQALEIPKSIQECDKTLALQMAGAILFDAFDSGADFLLINNRRIFDILNDNMAQILKLVGRQIDGFYLLTFSEFLLLAENKTPKSLKNHSLKVLLV